MKNQPLFLSERSLIQNASRINRNPPTPTCAPIVVLSCMMYCSTMPRRVLKLLFSAIALFPEKPTAGVVAFTTSSTVVWKPHCDAVGRPLCYSASSGIRRQTSTIYRRGRSSPTTTSMSLLRTFEASELQLQRFIGELGFVEITDWYAQYLLQQTRRVMFFVCAAEQAHDHVYACAP